MTAKSAIGPKGLNRIDVKLPPKWDSCSHFDHIFGFAHTQK